MSIYALPLELLRLIFTYCDPESISSLSSTCHSLKHHALPLLYHDIDQHQRFTSPALPNIQLLTRSLIHNPTLGPKIKHLRLRGPEFWPSKSKTISNLSDIDLSLLASRGVQTGHSNLPVWHHVLLTNSREAILTILFSYLSSLTILAFEDDPNVQFNVHHSPLGSWNPPFATHPALGSKPNSLFAQALTKLPCLRTVELGLCNEGVRLGHNTPVLRVLQSLSSLHKLSIALRQPPATSSSTYFPLPLPVDLPASGLTTLCIHDCALSERSTILVTSRFPNLTTLSISFLRRALSPTERLAGRIPPDSHTWLDCELLGEYLASSPLTKLQHLSLALFFQTQSTSDLVLKNGAAYECGRSGILNSDPICFFGIKRSIGSLQYLTSLKTLSIPTPMLLGWYPDEAEPLRSLVPESLEELSFRGDVSHWDLYKWDACSLQDWIKSVESVGNLRIIKCEGPEDQRGGRNSPEIGEST